MFFETLRDSVCRMFQERSRRRLRRRRTRFSTDFNVAAEVVELRQMLSGAVAAIVVPQIVTAPQATNSAPAMSANSPAVQSSVNAPERLWICDTRWVRSCTDPPCLRV